MIVKMVENGISMYFNEKISSEFAEQEQNDKNRAVADIFDRIVLEKFSNFNDPLHVAELGGGAHPDRYHRIFERLLKNKGLIDWVDISPVMLNLAKKYLNKKEYIQRKEVISFIKKDLIEYLNELKNDSLDFVLMKYTFDHLKDIEILIKLLSKKLKKNGFLIANLTTVSPMLKSFSTNAKYLYKNQEFPENETRTLNEGEEFIVKHLKVSGDPSRGCIEGAQVTKYYHSPKKIKDICKKYNLNIFIGDWKKLLNLKEGMNQDVVLITK